MPERDHTEEKPRQLIHHYSMSVRREGHGYSATILRDGERDGFINPRIALETARREGIDYVRRARRSDLMRSLGR